MNIMRLFLLFTLTCNLTAYSANHHKVKKNAIPLSKAISGINNFFSNDYRYVLQNQPGKEAKPVKQLRPAVNKMIGEITEDMRQGTINPTSILDVDTLHDLAEKYKAPRKTINYIERVARRMPCSRAERLELDRRAALRAKVVK